MPIKRGVRTQWHFPPKLPCSHTQLTHVGVLDLKNVSVTKLWGEAYMAQSAVGQWVIEQQDEASLGSLSPCGLLTRISLMQLLASLTPDQEPLLISTPIPLPWHINPATRFSEFSRETAIPSLYGTS